MFILKPKQQENKYVMFILSVKHWLCLFSKPGTGKRDNGEKKQWRKKKRKKY